MEFSKRAIGAASLAAAAALLLAAERAPAQGSDRDELCTAGAALIDRFDLRESPTPVRERAGWAPPKRIVVADVDAATRGMFDAEFFAAMKESAFFINIGRGESVVTDDLTASLQSGAIAGAGLGVTDPEPLSPFFRSSTWTRVLNELRQAVASFCLSRHLVQQLNIRAGQFGRQQRDIDAVFRLLSRRLCRRRPP